MKIKAVRRETTCAMFGQHEIDLSKVARLVAHLRSGGEVPPVVVAEYGDKVLPIDGHHRLSAFGEMGWSTVDAWVVSGQAFDRLCAAHRDAESHIDCGGVNALEVASAWVEMKARSGDALDGEPSCGLEAGRCANGS